MKKTLLSVIILTKNSQETIDRCLTSVAWCDEIIIVDDYSEDETTARITHKNPAATIYQRHLARDFSAQRNFGLEKAHGEWILFVDSDEVISDILQEEIKKEIKQPGNHTGFYLPRRDYFLGKWLQYGETNRTKFLRIAKKRAGVWKGRVHETWEIEGGKKVLKNPILHYPHESIAYFLKKINEYTDIVAQYWKEKGRKMSSWEIFVYPIGKFIQNYVLRLGFLDGTAGVIVALMMSFHSFLARSKYWLMRQNKSDV